MHFNSSRWLVLSCTLVASTGWAQDFPTKPVRIVVPFVAGSSSNDILARYLAERLRGPLGQQVLVENRPGNTGLVGAELVARAAPDGYVLLVATNGPQAIAPSIFKLNFDTQKDLTGVAMIANVPYMLLVHPSLPVTNVKELVALARQRPGQLLFASSGYAGTPQMCWELLKSMTGIDLVHVPYKGGAPAMMDTIGGQTQLYCSGLISAGSQIKAGKLRAIGMGTLQRSSILPDIPTVAEQGFPGYDVASWFGFMAPAKTPPTILQRLYSELAKIVQTDETRKFLVTQGAEPMLMDPGQFNGFLKQETEKWVKVVRAAKLKLD